MKKQFLFLSIIIGFSPALAQKRTFYQEGKLVDSIQSPVLQHFSSLYDTVFAYDVHDDWMMLKRHCRIFAIKQGNYYKIDCRIGFFANDVFTLTVFK